MSMLKKIEARSWLFWTALLFALGEFIDAFNTVDVITGIVFALIVAACAIWLRMRYSRIPVTILLALSTLELAAVIFLYPHASPPVAGWRLVLFFVLSAAVLICAVLTLLQKN